VIGRLLLVNVARNAVEGNSVRFWRRYPPNRRRKKKERDWRTVFTRIDNVKVARQIFNDYIGRYVSPLTS
jgi:hypothetical protein